MTAPALRKAGRPRKSDLAGPDTRERIMDAAQALIQERGYANCSFKTIGDAVGLRTATLHHHFPTKADLGAAVTQRYREGVKARLSVIARESSDTDRHLARYAEVYRDVLATENRLCLCAAMAAESETLPPQVMAEVTAFFDTHETWLTTVFEQRGAKDPMAEARAYLSLLEGAMLVARARHDIDWFDATVARFLDAQATP